MDIIIEGKPISSLRVVDLKVLLEKRGLSKSGTKKDLLDRLTQYLRDNPDDPGITKLQQHDASEDEEGHQNRLPGVVVSGDLQDNEFIQEYMRMRESHYQSAMSDLEMEKAKESEAEREAPAAASKNKEKKPEDPVPVEPTRPEQEVDKNMEKEGDQQLDGPELSQQPSQAQKSETETTKRVEPADEADCDEIVVNNNETIFEDDLSQDAADSGENDQAPSERRDEPTTATEAATKKEQEKMITEDKECGVEPEPSKQEPDIPFRTLSRTMSCQHPEKRDRKRKWCSTVKDEPTPVISSQQLKDIIPDVKQYLEDLKTFQDDDKDVAVAIKHDDTEEKLEYPAPKKPNLDKDSAKAVQNEETSPESGGAKRAKEAPMVEDDGSNARPLKQLQENEMRMDLDVQVKNGDAKEMKHEMDKRNEERAKPRQEAPSCVVSVRHLVRPFTLSQLKELLRRTGRIVEPDGFWIDKIKSQALVQYVSVEEAEETVAALDGVQWPVTNPKLLSVTFSTEQALRQAMEGDQDALPAATHTLPSTQARQPIVADSSKTAERPKGPSSQGKEEVATSPVKSLDDLFRKTKAQPSIYWLPCHL